LFLKNPLTRGGEQFSLRGRRRSLGGARWRIWCRLFRLLFEGEFDEFDDARIEIRTVPR
jgi:hypothetical protein